ncbi:MAG: hypothetical protein CVU85_00555 [Firmicutes bacterium HGW-Firmicutes-10]|jgi:hypothetical protein|nr:MAG: hypothetical protein CVU85_00555 [Firmicutes bacterium HGW-Firmicutes-10]
MKHLNHHIKKYNESLIEGHIQKAYRGIIDTISQLKTTWDSRYPTTPSGSLYAGFMDMTFISVKPSVLSDMDLRVSIVYMHESHTFEVWLVARNRKIQSTVHNQLRSKELGKYSLTELGPGVDSIIALTLNSEPDFNDIEVLINEIIEKTWNFILDMTDLVR